jgi:hypothetical protein
MDQAGLLAQIDPLVWHTNWNVHSQATPDGHTSFKYLAPYVFKVAISNSRLVSLKDRTVTCTSRPPDRARLRTTQLDVMACLRSFLPHVLPEGFMQVRHCGLLHARCAIAADPLGPMLVQAHPTHGQLTRIVPPEPLAALCPTCGMPMRLVMRLGTSHRAFVDTG